MDNPRMNREGDPYAPRHVVWELTMRCDHACAHCGSRAVKPRESELEEAELLEVAAAVLRMGVREVALIGGEAYLHPAFLKVARALVQGGARVVVQSGGRGITASLAQQMAEAGIAALGVSIDGPEAAHDTLRAARGSFRAGIAALGHARAAGMMTGVNTQVNRLNHHLLRETLEALLPTGIQAWRAQLTAPMGRAADRPDWILQPWEILGVIDTLAALQLEHAERARAAGLPPRRMLDVQISHNLGYFGPHEQLLRSRPGGWAEHYRGCSAGKYTLGIESDGKVKGCPSLPTAPYVGGNLRDMTLEQLWETPEVAFARERSTDELWGFCRTCIYADVCRGGCSFTAHTTLGRRGNNPFCYHRAETLRKRGLRERLVHVDAAAGQPYDFGRFELVEEPWEDL